MIIKVDDWVFDVDLDTTMVYSAQEAQEHCTCGYCRNFYTAVDGVYPGLRPFLAQFGVDIEAPDQLIPYEPTLMDGFYAISGRVIRFGSKPMFIDGLSICVADSDDLHVNVCCPEPYFVLNTGLMELPWVLDEKMEDVVSPANDPDFLDEIASKGLTFPPNGYIQ
jgi:hypothetical protein